MKIAIELITLHYTCPDCSEKGQQCLDSIVECGTAICPECDIDMDLVSAEVAGANETKP